MEIGKLIRNLIRSPKKIPKAVWIIAVAGAVIATSLDLYLNTQNEFYYRARVDERDAFINLIFLHLFTTSPLIALAIFLLKKLSHQIKRSGVVIIFLALLLGTYSLVDLLVETYFGRSMISFQIMFGVAFFCALTYLTNLAFKISNIYVSDTEA